MASPGTLSESKDGEHDKEEQHKKSVRFGEQGAQVRSLDEDSVALSEGHTIKDSGIDTGLSSSNNTIYEELFSRRRGRQVDPPSMRTNH